MRKSKFTESQILAILGAGEAGLAVAAVCRKHGISTATYYQWNSKYAGMSANELRRVKDLEAEKRGAAECMVSEPHISLSKACQIAGFSRSALYKPTVDWPAKGAPVIAALNEMVSKRIRWGFWKCFHRRRADGHEWNHKRVHHVYCAMKLNLQRKANKRVITRERQPL